MPNPTTPSRNSVNDAIALTHLLRPDWDETWARIPAWHPRNEVDPAAAAAAQQQVDWESDDNPYRKRFTDTQASFTQNQQRLKDLERYEQDPTAYLELGKKQGWIEIDDPNQPPPDNGQQPDPYADRFAALEAKQAAFDARIQQENAAAGEELFHADLDTWAKTENIELSKADHNAIFGLLMQSPDPTQESAARQIFEAHVADKKAEREALEAEIREQMRRPRVPHTPANGGTDTGVVNYDDMSRAEIDRAMAEQVRAANQR